MIDLMHLLKIIPFFYSGNIGRIFCAIKTKTALDSIPFATINAVFNNILWCSCKQNNSVTFLICIPASKEYKAIPIDFLHLKAA